MTTRALAALTALIVVSVTLITALAWSLTRDTQPAAPPRIPTAADTPTYNPSAGDAADDGHDPPAEAEEAAWGPIADTFARNFTNTHGGPSSWRLRLIGNPSRPNVTTEVADQLTTIDLNNIPTGHYTGHQLVKSSQYDLAVKVNYREGWAMILYLITDGTNWQIYAYDKWQP